VGTAAPGCPSSEALQGLSFRPARNAIIAPFDF
jgi:hypothetical protein